MLELRLAKVWGDASTNSSGGRSSRTEETDQLGNHGIRQQTGTPTCRRRICVEQRWFPGDNDARCYPLQWLEENQHRLDSSWRCTRRTLHKIASCIIIIVSTSNNIASTLYISSLVSYFDYTYLLIIHVVLVVLVFNNCNSTRSIRVTDCFSPS